MSIKRRILIGLGIFLALTVSFTAYLGLRVVGDLRAARSVLEGRTGVPTARDLSIAGNHVSDAADRLDSWPARVVTLIPLIRQNVLAARAVLTASVPVLDAAGRLVAAVEPIRTGGLIADQRFDLAQLEELEPSVADTAEALERLNRAAASELTGALVPPLWDLMEEIRDRSERFLSTLRKAQTALAIAPDLLGANGSRTYLVVLINNAELRGAGGIPSGVGTLEADDGRLILGEFKHTVLLRGKKPYERVPAPPGFRARFGQFDADTTFWTNTTFSPDVPDVALVAARLYETATEIRSDGVIIIDPRGIASLVPEAAEIDVPIAEVGLGRDSLADFVYSRAYSQLGGQGPRRDLLIAVGARAFSEILAGGLRTEDDMTEAVRSAAGGHIRVVSLHPNEQVVLDEGGISGDLEVPDSDHLLVTTQNTGGDKLDYWIQRDIEHSCRIEADHADCVGVVGFSNLAPDGLTRYVAGRPYGRAQMFAEIYIPDGAELGSVDINGAPTSFFPAEQSGHEVIGVEVDAPQGTTTEVSWSYRLPISEGYEIEISPQPLARDATVRVRLEIPETWVFEGPGDVVDNTLSYNGVLNAPLSMAAHPDERNGIPALWERLLRFWKEPVF